MYQPSFSVFNYKMLSYQPPSKVFIDKHGRVSDLPVCLMTSVVLSAVLSGVELQAWSYQPSSRGINY